MSISFGDFWKLAAESRLLTPQQCQQLHHDFSQIKGAVETGSAKTLAEWLVSRNVISRYQQTILLMGRPGPFVYGDYRVYDRIDAGRLAGKFRALHGPTGHPVLLEFLTGPMTTDPQRWALAANEAAATAAVVSPYLQRRHEVVDLTTFKFIVGEDLRGASMEERLSAGRLPPQEACRVMLCAALGLAQLHQSGIIHGDIRPANIFLEAIPNHPGHVRLLREPLFSPQPPPMPGQADPAGRLTQTADYSAPEFLQQGKQPDPLTDIYALGCSFYTLLAGSPPFAGGPLEQKLHRHAAEPIRPLEQYGIPQPIAQLVAYLMAKNPAVRYQQANVVAEQLAAYVDPQLLYLPPPQPPQTFPAFEAWVKQKQTVLAAKAGASAAAPAGIATGKAVGPTSAAPAAGGSSIKVGPEFDKLGAASVSGGKSDVAIKTPDKPSAIKNLKEKSEKEKTKQVIYALCGVGGLAIIALIAISASNSGKKPAVDGEQVTEVPPGPVTPAVDPKAQVTPAVTSPPVVPTTSVATTPMKVPGENTPPTDPVSTTNPGGPVKPKPGPVVDAPLSQAVVADDGKMLWASPTSGKPVTLRGVPPEGQIFINLRPAAMLRTPEGKRVLEALGPEFGGGLKDWETGAGFSLAGVDRLLISFHNNEGKFPRISYVVYPQGEVTTETMLEKWGDPEPRKDKDGTHYTAKGWAYSIPTPGEEGPLFVMSKDVEMIKDGLTLKGAPPVLRKEVERLRRATDADRHVTALFYPNFFSNNDGEPLFSGNFARLKNPLLWLMGDDLQAGSASAHFEGEFYYEVRMLANLGKDKLVLASEFRERLKVIPDNILTYIAEMNPPPYWRKLAFKFPPMINQMHEQTRVGVEDESAVVNCVLPAAAGHNLALGFELTLSTTPGGAGAAVVASNPKSTSNIKSIDDVLNTKTSFMFDATSLEFAMRDLGNEGKELAKGSPVQFEVRILGDDLKQDGITRNMSINNFKQENKSLADVLTALVMRANPITTVKDPSEADQKLLWVVGPDPDDAKKTIVLITTRAKATERKYTLPPPFMKK